MLVYRVTISDAGTAHLPPDQRRPFCHFETPKKYVAERYKERAEALGQHVEIVERYTAYDPT